MGSLESDTTERLHFHFPLSCIGEGNGNPLQCSCLENPRDGGAWWAAVYGVAQSRTRLKRHSSSSRVKNALNTGRSVRPVPGPGGRAAIALPVNSSGSGRLAALLPKPQLSTYLTF